MSSNKTWVDWFKNSFAGSFNRHVISGGMPNRYVLPNFVNVTVNGVRYKVYRVEERTYVMLGTQLVRARRKVLVAADYAFALMDAKLVHSE